MAFKHEKECLDCIERLAAAGYRLQQLAGGAEVPDGDMLFACKDGTFSEEIAQQRIRGLRIRLHNAEEFIREVAWRFSDFATANWSGPDVLAHVADYFNCTVKELLQQMEDAGR